MSHTIWKFPLQAADSQTIRMDANAKILTVGAQHGNAVLWAMVDPDAPTAPFVVNIHGTGHDVIDPQLPYIGTFFIDNDWGQLVFHVFAGKVQP
jgi:hypothetical protein